jgi:hypothetical protein
MTPPKARGEIATAKDSLLPGGKAKLVVDDTGQRAASREKVGISKDVSARRSCGSRG